LTEVVKKARVVPAKEGVVDDENDGNKKIKKERQRNTQAPAKWVSHSPTTTHDFSHGSLLQFRNISSRSVPPIFVVEML